MPKRESLSKVLIYLLILLLPVQLGTFFFFDFSYVSGVKIDYLAPALYLTDIITVLIILINIPSLHKMPTRVYLFILLLLLNICISFSPAIGLYRFTKILELIGLFIVVNPTILSYKKVLIFLLAGSIVQLSLGAFQIAKESSLQGIWYFLGERSFNISTAGIAKISFDGTEILRPYGSFSHPNSLAGFYLLIYTYILFSKAFIPYKAVKYTTLGMMSVLIFFSFSKVVMLSYLIITIYYTFRNLRKACWICIFSKVFTACTFTLLFLKAKGDPHTIEKRIYLMQSSLTILWDNLLLGTGLGNYLYAQSTIRNPYPYHFLEPVHNILLLPLAELGIPLFIFFIYSIFPYLKKWWNHDVGRALLMVILLTGMFDHYWLTLQQNMLLLPIVFGLLKNEGRYDKIERTKNTLKQANV